MIPIALTIAGSDPSGGAGIQADLQTFHEHGVYGTSVITLLTAQNTQCVKEVLVIDALKVAEQLDVLLEDITPQAAKTGALGDEKIVRELAIRLKHVHFPLVVDPVMLSTHGTPLMSLSAREALKTYLLPVAFLVTPNLQEAEMLTGLSVKTLDEMEKAAHKIASFGPKAVLIKGGHLEKEATDLLLYQGQVKRFEAPRIQSSHTHGTGCVFSAAICAELAKGTPLIEAVEKAKIFIDQAIRHAPGIGHGLGPVNINLRN
jgi:hydroxymethylpyrimidine/phosphomethylpyrimidine kinase